MTTDRDVLRHTFERAFNRDPEIASEAPGRVNLIGEHTDYNEGFVLPVAIDRTVAVAAAPTDAKTVRVYSADFDARDEWRLDAPRRTGRREWRDYLRGVAWALLDAGYALQGADLAIAGDVPQGAGLSSSAALEMAVAGALCGVAGIKLDPERLALLSQKAESQFVGVQCGIMDQLTAALGRSAHALLIDCRSLEIEHVPLPDDRAIVVVDSKVPRVLGDTPYNQRREECAAAAEALAVPSLRDAAMRDIARLPDPLNRRARHVVTENRRVLDAVEALRVGDSAHLGKLMFESHSSLRDDFEVSTPELDLLVELASRAEGVVGAKLTGAGFGGSTVNLVRLEAVGDIQVGLVDAYRKRTGRAAEMYICEPADGLVVRRV